MEKQAVVNGANPFSKALVCMERRACKKLGGCWLGGHTARSDEDKTEGAHESKNRVTSVAMALNAKQFLITVKITNHGSTW